MSYNTYKPAYPSRTLWFTPVILVGSVLLIFLAFRVVLVRYFVALNTIISLSNNPNLHYAVDFYHTTNQCTFIPTDMDL
jgi:hypothetical protein